MSRVVVIGGGPAGMFAAIATAENGHHVTLLEKNEKLGKKLFITGKGRCNITNSSDMDVLYQTASLNIIEDGPMIAYAAITETLT